MGKIDQVARLLKSGPKRIDEIRAAVPRLHGHLLDEAVKAGIFCVTGDLWHLPNVEVRNVPSVEVALGQLAKEIKAVEKRVSELENKQQ